MVALRVSLVNAVLAPSNDNFPASQCVRRPTGTGRQRQVTSDNGDRLSG
jgi:hypothetical protein